MSKRNRTRGAANSGQRPQRAVEGYDNEILDALERAGSPLTRRELAEGLGVSARAGAAFDEALAALEKSGRAVQNRAGAYLVARRIGVGAGRTEGHRDGHGFLAPDDGGEWVFLEPAEMRTLMHGDRASVRVEGRDQRGRPFGKLVEVLEHANRHIVGTLHDERGVLVLRPEDRRVAHDILVPPANVGRAKAGQVVTVELLAQPAKHAPPVGRVVEVLGRHGDSGIEIEIAVRKFGLPHEFSKRAQGLARAMPDEVRPGDAKGRKDLRSLPFVTIDGETAKDFDDAVHAIPQGGGFR